MPLKIVPQKMKKIECAKSENLDSMNKHAVMSENSILYQIDDGNIDF